MPGDSVDIQHRRAWHLEKTLSVGHILTTGALFFVLITGWVEMSNRVAVLESKQDEFNDRILTILNNQNQIDGRQDVEILEVKREIRENYRTIDLKLDNLVLALRNNDN